MAQRSTRRRRRAGPAEPDATQHDLGSPAHPESVARTIVLNKLTAQARSRHELAEALAARAVPDDVAERVLDRFTEVGLIDDAAHAQAWVSSRQSTRGLARKALAQELRGKGIDEDVIRSSLEQVQADDERHAAHALVARKLSQHPATRSRHSHPATRSQPARSQGLSRWAGNASSERGTGPRRRGCRQQPRQVRTPADVTAVAAVDRLNRLSWNEPTGQSVIPAMGRRSGREDISPHRGGDEEMGSRAHHCWCGAVGRLHVPRFQSYRCHVVDGSRDVVRYGILTGLGGGHGNWDGL